MTQQLPLPCRGCTGDPGNHCDPWCGQAVKPRKGQQLALPHTGAMPRPPRGPLRAVTDAGPQGLGTWLRLECGHESYTSAIKLPMRSHCPECKA